MPRRLVPDRYRQQARLRQHVRYLGPERRRGGQLVSPIAESAPHAPGNRRMCLATMLSWISLVPPSMELPFDRSQVRAVLSFSHSRAALPRAAITSSLRRLLSSVPAYFIMLGEAG